MSDIPQLVKHKVFQDPTPNGLINQRIIQHFFFMAEQHTDLTGEDRKQWFRVLLLVAKKLVSVWQHKERYCSTEKELVTEATEPKAGGQAGILEVDNSEDLFIEFDEFLVQLKSTLDYLVHLPVPIFGRKVWGLHTFGKKGESVTKALRRNLPTRYRDRAKGVAAMLIGENRAWLNDTIHARDKVNHYLDGGIPFEHFSVGRNSDGSIRVPMWSSEQSISGFMEVVWHNLFKFVEDFAAHFLFFRFGPGLALFHGESEISSPSSPWVVTTEAERKAHTSKPGWAKL